MHTHSAQSRVPYDETRTAAKKHRQRVFLAECAITPLHVFFRILMACSPAGQTHVLRAETGGLKKSSGFGNIVVELFGTPNYGYLETRSL